MAAINYVFQRYEKKYLLDQDQYEKVKQIFQGKLEVDEYGLHNICNIYYDTDQYDLIRRSIDKPVYKEKFRLRCYGVPSDHDMVYLEIKKKYEDVVYKRRVGMTLLQAMNYLERGEKPDETSQILREIDYFFSYYQPKPKVYIAYDRTALYGLQDNRVRVTFDQNIRYRFNDLYLQNGDYGDRLLPDDIYLMEIKVQGAFPLWLTKALNKISIYPISYSKYGAIYKNELMKSTIGGPIC